MAKASGREESRGLARGERRAASGVQVPCSTITGLGSCAFGREASTARFHTGPYAQFRIRLVSRRTKGPGFPGPSLTRGRRILVGAEAEVQTSAHHTEINIVVEV